MSSRHRPGHHAHGPTRCTVSRLEALALILAYAEADTQAQQTILRHCNLVEVAPQLASIAVRLGINTYATGDIAELAGVIARWQHELIVPDTPDTP